MAKSSNTKTPAKTTSALSASVTIDPKHSRLMEYFVDELKDVYYAEKLLLKALKKQSKKATTPELKQAFLDHNAETENQVARLEQIFAMVGKKAQAKKCEAMTGIIEEAESVIEDTDDDTLTRDVALIIGAQKAEHYEIASYGGLIALAKVMGHTEIADILYQTLEEEKATDAKLTAIAEGSINAQANEEPAVEEEDEDEDDKIQEPGEDEEPESEKESAPKKSAKKAAPKKGAAKKSK